MINELLGLHKMERRLGARVQEVEVGIVIKVGTDGNIRKNRVVARNKNLYVVAYSE